MGRVTTAKANHKSAKIKFCKESTITEAWCVIRGSNYPHTKDVEPESDAIVTTARKHTKDLVVDPSVVLVSSKLGDQIRPFWIRQCSWEDKKRIARIGYSYLSLHRVCNPEVKDKYDRYNSEILPYLRNWLTFFKDGSLSSESQAIASVSFGYRNRFNFELTEDFDPSNYFKLVMGIDIGQNGNDFAIAEAESAYAFTNTKTQSQLNFSMRIADRPGTNRVVVETQCIAELLNFDNTNFSQGAKILNLVRNAQTEAKELFFSIATQKTLDEVLKAEREK